MHTYSHNYKLLGPAEIEGRQGWRNIHPKILPKSRGFGQYPVPRASRVPDSARNLISYGRTHYKQTAGCRITTSADCTTEMKLDEHEAVKVEESEGKTSGESPISTVS